jgi:N-acetyl-gamma-glutamyl-phosphate reductase
MSLSVAIAGASGYSGAELIRLLANHPEFEIHYIYGQSHVGETLAQVHPQFLNIDLEFLSMNEMNKNKTDLTFLALPSGVAGNFLNESNISGKIIDLSGDFRLKSETAWNEYYSGKYWGSWTYGLPELINQKVQISKAFQLANPGCYATAANLSLLPAVSGEIVSNGTISLVAASGTTGAGRVAKINLINSEVNNNLSAYKLGGVHQHIPEIEQVINSATDKNYLISFIPILAPMPRGILSTINFETSANLDSIMSLYKDYYSRSLFVNILDDTVSANTKSVLGSNSVQISIFKDKHTNQAQIVTAIDNLGKGAAGQAIQNANIMFGFNEQTGLAVNGLGA